LYAYGILTTFGNPCSIFNNEVYNLEANNSNATVYGINVGSSFGTSVHNIYNNFVSDLRTPITNAAINLAGISVLYGTTVNVFNNTVYLNATSTGALFGSAAIYAAGSSANPVLDLRNNVLVNVSVPNGTGITAAYRRSNSTLTNYSNNSNANCFYAGTPGPNNLIFFDGTTPYQTLSAYQSLVAPRDAASFTENPPFINVAATPYDLHIQTGVNTLCESGGLVVSSPFAVTNDFDSQPRYPNSGYPDNPGQPATAPDAGADEFAGGLLPPSLTFTVDMSTAEGFAPGADVVYLAGSFPGATWNEPGTNPALMMAQVGSTLIYTLTLTLPAGTYEYKYFKNAGWGGAEWAGGSNRSATFATTTTLYDTWGGSISWANLQYPGSGNITEGGTYAVYGQAYIPNGITYAPGVAYGLEAWVGISSTNTDPTGWTTWIPATFNTQAANNDEFTANIATGLTAGTYYYAFRYRFGQTYGEYLYGGFSAGYWNGTTNVNGVLTVDPPATKTLDLSLYLEGLYAGSNIMNKAQDEMGDHFPGTVADQITVELHNYLDYLTIEYQAQNVDLNTDGTATILIPNIYSGMYWLTIKHRNSVETTSSVVVDFSGAMISYDFTTQATQAYGDNMIDLGEGVFGLFVGDANQDGLIDGDDLAFMDPAVIAGNIGYLASDLNGDGLVDGDDLVKGDANFTTGIALVTP
jgi:hypothetical protein